MGGVLPDFIAFVAGNFLNRKRVDESVRHPRVYLARPREISPGMGIHFVDHSIRRRSVPQK